MNFYDARTFQRSGGDSWSIHRQDVNDTWYWKSAKTRWIGAIDTEP